MSCSLSTIMMPKRPRVLSAGKGFAGTHLARHTPVEFVTLGNGVKVASQSVSGSQMATVGVRSRAGSRWQVNGPPSGSAEYMDENGAVNAGTNGSALLLHKAMWKSADVQKRVAALGGQLELQMDRDYQSASITCLKDDVPAALALLADVTQKPRLDDATVDAARGAAIDEMKDAENRMFPDQILDNLHRICYDSTDQIVGGGLGISPFSNGQHNRITGVTKMPTKQCQHSLTGSVDQKNKPLTAAEIQSWHDEFVNNGAHNTVVGVGAVGGGFQAEVEKLFGGMPNKAAAPTTKRFIGGSLRCIAESGHEAILSHADSVNAGRYYGNNWVHAWEIPPYKCADHLALKMLAEAYGSYDRFQEDLTTNFGLQEIYHNFYYQHGMARLEELRPLYLQYEDTGLMGVYWTYLIGAHENSIDGLTLTHYNTMQWRDYCHKLSNTETEKAKNMLKASLLFAADGSTKSKAAAIAEEMSYLGRVVPLEENFARIDALGTNQLSDTFDHYYTDREFGMTGYAQSDNQPVYALTKGAHKPDQYLGGIISVDQPLWRKAGGWYSQFP